MKTQPSQPTHTTKEKISGFANKLNGGNKLGVCSLLLVFSLTVTPAIMAQDYRLITREKQSEIRADYLSPGNKSQKIMLKANKADVLPENHTSWDTISKLSKEKEGTMFFYGQLHSIDENAHALIYILTSDNTPYFGIVPQGICTEEGWASILKLKPRPDFAEKWGYKIPTAPNEVTIAGSDKPFDNPKVQEETPSFTKPTMPVERTITNTKGVAIEGTVLSKTDSAISFQRKGNGGPVDINLDLLSPEDQAFIATLVDKKSVKPTVLLKLKRSYKENQETIKWLKDNGFDVIIGVTGDVKSNRKGGEIPDEQAVIKIESPETTDQFPIVWIDRFSPNVETVASDTAITNHRKKTGGLTVIPTHSRLAKMDRFLSSENYYKGSPMLGKEEEAYTKTDENFIFCSNKTPHSTDEKMREKLLAAIKEQIAR